jgi:urea carboxylase
MWNRYHEVADFAGKPWLLRFFDQLRFYPVSAEELLEIRRDFPLGRYPLRIEHSTLRLAEYQQFLAREAQSISAFRDHQQRAFNAERERWIASGQAHFDSQESARRGGRCAAAAGEQGWKARYPAICGRYRPRWAPGAGDVLVVLESMKMEIPLLAPCDGRVQQVNVQPGSAVRAGQRVAVIIEEKA